jgi:hypothetical protein
MSWKTAGHGLAVVALTLALWSGLFAVQAHALSTCQDSCDTFLDFERADPLCIADPTCVSPLYKVTDSKAQHWSGIAYYRLGWERDYPSASLALAMPNYIIFMLLAIAAVALVGRRVGARYALLAIFVWSMASAISWFSPRLHPLWIDFAPGHASLWIDFAPGHASLWLEMGLIGLSLSLLTATVHVSRRST